MSRERELERRLRSLGALSEAVATMKSLSAHHFIDARQALEPARRYREGVDRIVRHSDASLPPGRGAVGLLVVGAELGLCGGYNAHLAEAAADERRARGPGPTLCVGRRLALHLGRQGLPPTASYAMPAGARGIPELLLPLTEAMLERWLAEDLSAFVALSSRFEGVGAGRPEVTVLLPITPPDAAFAAAPEDAPAPRVRYSSARHLAEAAVRERLYIAMHDLLIDALASEHGARLVATQAAERWLDERKERVLRRLAEARRETQTQEMLEIAGGARARR
ncbi:MAG: FoF1 ATP synthase subunit gamma [Myxococcota bacterium]